MHSKIKDVLADNTSAISFTIDGWTAINGKSYYGITGHFITDDFKYHSIALDFVASNGKHSGVEIAKMFFTSLKGYGILHKVQGITVDNCAANSTFIQEFTNLMANDGFQFDSQNQHFRCVAHVLNLAVQSAIILFKVYTEDRELEDDSDNSNDEIEECNQLSPFFKLRMIFKKLKRSEQLQIKFKNFCNLFSEKYVSPIVDVCTRWNSTYNMLKTGLGMKRSINAICAETDFSQWQLTEDEWEVMQKFASFLKNFVSISTLIGGDKYATLPMVVLTYNMVLDKIEATAKQLEQQNTRNVLEDSLMDAYQAAYDKMVCYYAKTNWICCLVLILDPRHKVETFNLTKWGKEIIDETLEKFKNIFKEKYYVAPLQDAQPVLSSDDEDIDIKRLFMNRTVWTNEIDSYLGSCRVNRDVDIIDWWKNNQATYPCLAKMARDFLSIPATSVPSERLFSKAGLIIRKHRNRLSNESARLLLCLNSWVISDVTKHIFDDAEFTE